MSHPRRFTVPAMPNGRRLLVVAALSMLTLMLVLAAGCSSEKSASGAPGTITRSFGTTGPCQSTTIPLQPKQGVDLAQQGEKLVDSFTGAPGIGDVVLDPAKQTISVTWCIDQTSEQGVVRALALSNLVTLGQPVTTPL